MKQAQSAGQGREKGRLSWRGVAFAVGLLAGVVLGALAMQAWQSHQRKQATHEELSLLAQQVTSHQQQSARSQALADTLSGELVVQRGTVKGLQAELAAAQVQLGQAREALAFYEQLIPPGPKGSLTIRAFSVQPVGTALRYRVLLTRNAANGAPFQGKLQFVAHGTVNGQAVQRVLEPATVTESNGNDDTLDLTLDQFQRREGMLRLPDNFFPDKVSLNVLEGDALRVSQELTIEASN